MKMLIHYRGDHPVYVEGFAEGCKRSVTGSLHVLPKKHITVTEDEYNHMVAEYPDMMKFVKVVAKSADAEDAPVSVEPPAVPTDTPADGATKFWKKGKGSGK